MCVDGHLIGANACVKKDDPLKKKKIGEVVGHLPQDFGFL